MAVKKLVDELIKKEPKTIVEVMAFMSYNPSIGRVLQKEGINIFRQMAVEKVKKLPTLDSETKFDRFHRKWLEEFIGKIKRNNIKKCSVGQAQKAINVFLKLYVDWAKRPDLKTATNVLPFLHVPLDSILMKTIAERFPDFFNKKIRPLRKDNYTNSLSKIEVDEYEEWQQFFRKQHPKKPILFDIIWAMKRRNDN